MGFVKSLTARPKADYAGAQSSRLTLDWIMSHKSVDQEVRGALIDLRSRARELVRNTSWVRRYTKMLVQNIVGSKGIRLQARMQKAGKPFEVGNKRLESAWAEWGRPGTCTVDGKHSWRGLQGLVIQNMPSDGEALIRIVRNFDNDFGFALQVLDPDQLDEKHNVLRDPTTGNEIRMGVELNSWGRPVAYHIWSGHPSEWNKRTRKRVPAEDIIHLGDPDRPGQTRYVPWVVAVMLDLNMLSGYFEAELVASRVAASQAAFFTRKEGDIGGNPDEAKSSDPLLVPVEPGTYTALPVGVDVTAFKPEHPTTAFKDFVKSVLRSVATGLNVSYTALAGDLEGVNYSSIRQGVLDERDAYRDKQQWMIEHFHQRVYEEWLPWAVLSGRLDSRVSADQYSNIIWQPRGWTWVDPLKDQQAIIKGIENQLGSRTQALALQGVDYPEVIEDLEREEELKKLKGIKTPEPRRDRRALPGEDGEGSDEPRN